jgi:hypothetical protein
MTIEEYLTRIREILDEASGDTSLSKLEYQTLCMEVSDDCSDRSDAIDSELNGEDEDV